MSDDDNGAKGGLAKTVTSSFDQYEIVAVVTPGAAMLFGILLEWRPDFLANAGKETGLGDLGLFAIAAFVAGQILQAIAEVLDHLFWRCFGGLPTDWVVWCEHSPLAKEQRARLQERVKTELGGKHKLSDYLGDKSRWRWNRDEWHAVTRQINVAVSRAQRTARIEVFNRTYGLMRGIAVALAILGVVYWIVDERHALAGIPILVLSAFAGFRFYLFAKNYARELFVEYLALPAQKPASHAASR
jgi:hypothetical protein